MPTGHMYAGVYTECNTIHKVYYAKTDGQGPNTHTYTNTIKDQEQTSISGIFAS